MDALLIENTKDDLIILRPLTPRGTRWLETYPCFDSETLTVASELRQSITADALSEGVSLVSEAEEAAVCL